MTETTHRARAPRFYWTRYLGEEPGARGNGSTVPTGADLAALRRGLGREPGTVPAMWSHYTALNAEGRVTRQLRAEHIALSLFAVHQQSQDRLMHWPTVGVGAAMRLLRKSARHQGQPEALDRRFAAAATSGSLEEVSVHLRGLVTLLRHEGQGLDYTQLLRDLERWQQAAQQGSVRRRWGSQYFAWDDASPAAPSQSTASTVAGSPASTPAL